MLAAIVIAAGWMLQPLPAAGQAMARRPASQPAAGATAKGSDSSSGFSPYSTLRVVLALGLVVGGIFILRWCGVRMMGGPRGRNSRAISVVSRTVVSPRQQLMLIQVGRRLVLVGNSGTQMNPLCEIREPEEITELLGQLQGDKGDSSSRSFSAMFGPIGEKFQRDVKSEPAADAPGGLSVDREVDGEGLAATREELSGLREKVKGLARMLGK